MFVYSINKVMLQETPEGVLEENRVKLTTNKFLEVQNPRYTISTVEEEDAYIFVITIKGKNNFNCSKTQIYLKYKHRNIDVLSITVQFYIKCK